MKLVLIPFLLLFTGCTVSLESARDAGLAARNAGSEQAPALSKRCIEIDESRITWGAVAKGAGALAGASGVSTIPFDDTREAQIGLAATSAGLAVVSLVAVYISEAKDEQWARECSSR